MPLISVGVSVLSGFIGGVISQLAKSCVDYFWSLDFFIRQQVLQNMNSYDEEIVLKENDIISNESLIDTMITTLNGDNFGLFVFAAPVGSGKSTVIRIVLQEIKSRKLGMNLKLIKNGNSILQNQKFHECMKIPLNRPPCNYLPSNSCIIMDQIDFTVKSLSYSLCSYITDLATDSFNSKQYKIVMCVSNALLAKAIIECNGYEKIQPLCDFTSLVWSNDQLDCFIRLKLPNLPIEDIEKIRQLAQACKNSPGLVVKASSLVEKDCISKQQWEILNRYSNRNNNSWVEFEREG